MPRNPFSWIKNKVTNRTQCIVALLLTFAAGTPVMAAELTTPSGLTVEAGAVDRDIFHIVVYPKSSPPPPTSPFVVETSTPRHTSIRKEGGGIRVDLPSGTLSIRADGSFEVDEAKRLVVSMGAVEQTGGRLKMTFKHGDGERLYGLGNAGINHSGDLTHPADHQYVWNGCTRIPFRWSTGGWGFLVANDQDGSDWNDTGGELTWRAPGLYIDIYIMLSANFDVLDSYSRLTGRSPIPPRWTFGFMLSRWGYKDAADVQDKWHQFRDRKIPIDAFIYDYDWFNDDWNFNPKTFPDPAANLAQMHQMGLRFVGIRKPRINGANLDYARAHGWDLTAPMGTDLRFDIPAARDWWWSHQVPLVEAGVDGWWNDEAEQTIDEFFYMSMAQWNGGRTASKQRVWSLNRGFAPGMQRFGAAVWTGDIDTNWDVLANQPGTLLNWSLAGMPYVTQDDGGFQGTPDPELYTRWIEESLYTPVMRAHGTLGSPRWPWAFGDDALAATTRTIEMRYRLIPYLYTCAAETSQTGIPLMRPLFFEFPADPQTFNMRDEWLLGGHLLAAPILTKGGARDVYLPAGTWYDFNTNTSIEGGKTVHVDAPLDVTPAYVEAGTILPLGPVLQSTSLGVEDPLDIRVYPGGDTDFTLYEDDGTTYAYEHGACTRIPMHWDDRSRTLTVDKRRGRFDGMLSNRHLNVVLPDGTSRQAVYYGNKLKIQLP